MPYPFTASPSRRCWSTFAAVAALALPMLPSAGHATTTTVFVDGRAGPWDIAANPTFGYGLYYDVHLGPTIVTAASGLSFSAGSDLTIAYLSGTALAGANGTALGDGGNGVPGYAPFTPPCTVAPSCDIGVPGALEAFMGTFADSGGTIVGTPFIIGNGPFSALVPSGAIELLLGFNDQNYTDNGMGIEATVTDATIAAIPEPATTALLALGLGCIAAMRRSGRRDQQATSARVSSTTA